MNDADRAQSLIEAHADNALDKARLAVQNMPKGVEGDCEYCGKFSPRLVGTPRACAPCRDKHNLP